MLKRYSPLKRSGKPLARRKAPRRVSKAQSAEDRVYRIRCKAVKEVRTECECGCGRTTATHFLDVHHKEGRGVNYLRENTWMIVCRPCHRWIHDHPGQARAKGWLK